MWATNSSRDGGGPSKITSAPTCMCEACFSCARKDASTALRRSLWPCGDTKAAYLPPNPRHNALHAPSRSSARRAGRARRGFHHPRRDGERAVRELRLRRRLGRRRKGEPFRLAPGLAPPARAGRAGAAAGRLGHLTQASRAAEVAAAEWPL